MSIKKVADLAGVSIATVSRFFNNPEQVRKETRQKVEKAIAKTNYAPNSLAQNFRRGKTGLVIVVIPRVGDAFYDGIVSSLSQTARENGYNILVKEAQFNTLTLEHYQGMISSKQADGIVLFVGLSAGARKTLKPSSKYPPIVLACEPPTYKNHHRLPSVRIDNVAAAKEATNYLISLGHKNIAYISGDKKSTSATERESGYKAAMRSARLSSKATILEGGSSLSSAKEATHKLLDLPTRPTAIFCGNDEMAIGVLHEIKASKLKVPEDISIIGFDNIRYAEMTDPPLTTISQPAEDIGARTMELLCKAIDGHNMSNTIELLSHHLIVRKSTSSPHN